VAGSHTRSHKPSKSQVRFLSAATKIKQNMKTIIQQTNGYQLIAEIRPCINPSNLVELRFLSKMDNVKNPDECQVKYSLILTPEDRQRLKEFL